MASAGRIPHESGPRIRPMRAGDLPQVLDIEIDSFATPWSSRTFLNLLRRPNAALFVAEDVPGSVIGYAVVWFAGPEGELGDLAVRAPSRRRGVASSLVDAVAAEALERGSTEIYLEVRESNDAARSLYERHGFEIVNRRPGYYSDPVEDALVMRLQLAPGGAHTTK
ncbi:MAG: ribosomal protein S18-alanine N-acetyltransferase [Gemmatimonadota bacterium]|nr:ribosomal protein S18-alanine N-acetyltransferase [Gemmatimonadota bacterium]